MPTSRRALIVLFASFAVGPTPACVHVSGTVGPSEPLEVKPPITGDFAILPKRPGESVKTHSGVTTSVAKPLPDSPKPLPTAEPIIPQPANVVSVGKVEPNPLPLPTAPVPEPALLAAMRAFVENRTDDAIRHLQPLDRPNQDFALAVMPLLVRGSQMNLASANPEDVAVLVEQFHGIAGRLEPKAALKVEKVVFCRKVTGFGRYEPWPESQPYKPNDLAVLYVEVRNVGSEPSADQTFLSRAVVSLEVRDAAGKLIEQTDPANWRKRVPIARFEHLDHTRSPLRDYSRSYRISVPTQPGVYSVTVEVKDPANNRVARGPAVRFDVAGP